MSLPRHALPERQGGHNITHCGKRAPARRRFYSARKTGTDPSALEDSLRLGQSLFFYSARKTGTDPSALEDSLRLGQSLFCLVLCEDLVTRRAQGFRAAGEPVIPELHPFIRSQPDVWTGRALPERRTAR